MRIARFATLLLMCTPILPACASDKPVVKLPQTVWMEQMTWPEVRAAVNSGETTVIVPTGGTEQTGPHIVLGKHNFIIRNTAQRIAQRTHALVAPIMAYVPEGDIHPPTVHMRFPGTLSLRPTTFALVLEDTARSLKEHGFTVICFLGEHGLSQDIQQEVADKLDREWSKDGVRVVQVGNYYDSHNGQVAWAKKVGIADSDIEAHGGVADTAEMLAAYPQGVRINARADFRNGDSALTGAGGNALAATRAMGERFLALKVQAAVAQIIEAQSEMQRRR